MIPGADRVTPDAVVVEQGRAVVGLSTWLLGAAAAAARTGRELQVLTSASCRITYPLELMMADGVRWIVRAGSEFADGPTGAPVVWTGTRFAVCGSAPRPGDVGENGGLEVAIAVERPATVGAVAAAAVQALTGVEPDGWGIAEPVSQPWSVRELSAHCRRRAPRPTHLVVVGGGVLARLTGRPGPTGIREEIRIAGPILPGAAEALAASVGDRVHCMIVGTHPGRVGALRRSGGTWPLRPEALVVGSRVCRVRNYADLADVLAQVPEPRASAPTEGEGVRGDRGTSP